MSRSARRLVTIVMAVALVAAGCGSDDTSSTSGISTDGSPDSWISAFCQAGVNLADNLAPAADRLEDELSDIDPESFDLEQFFATMIAVFGDFAEPLGQFTSDVRSLGAPDVDGGDAFYEALTAGLDAADQAFAALASLPENPSLLDLQSLGDENPFAGLEALDGLDDFSSFPTELAESAESSDACTEVDRKFAELESKFEALDDLG